VVQFDIWGSRGSRSFVRRRSRIGNSTSCYSVLDGEELFVFDGGRGVAALSQAVRSEARFASVKRIHILITHSHMDHWEGLKDADWFWIPSNGLVVKLLGPNEALETIRDGFGPPSYVPLELLAVGTLARFEYVPVRAGDRKSVGRWTIRTAPLNHYSGEGPRRRDLDTIGYRLSAREGPAIAYLTDHEPSQKRDSAERRLVERAHLAVMDAHFVDFTDQQYGHGSQEGAAGIARRHPNTLVLGGHHGPVQTDAAIREGWRRHARGLSNYRIAVEGRTLVWNPRRRAFVERPRS
jgi:phosphoribosyl 1,2-cyclic phosphodiesterase